MERLTTLLSVITAALILAPAAHAQQNADPADLVGSRACGICHKKADEGDQLGNWQKSPHAKAFETLASEQSKKIAAERGIADPQQAGECLKCHATAYHFTTEVKTTKIKVEEGVSCESCHGAGKKYMPKSAHGESREKGIAAGMVHPATQSCKLCHNEESPTFKGFDEKTFAEKIAHPNPKSTR